MKTPLSLMTYHSVGRISDEPGISIIYYFNKTISYLSFLEIFRWSLVINYMHKATKLLIKYMAWRRGYWIKGNWILTQSSLKEVNFGESECRFKLDKCWISNHFKNYSLEMWNFLFNPCIEDNFKIRHCRHDYQVVWRMLFLSSCFIIVRCFVSWIFWK